MSENCEAKLSTHDDGKFVRTAVVCGPGEQSPSFALVDETGKRLAVVNVFRTEGLEWMAVDVCDVDDRFDHRRVLAFKDGTFNDLDCGSVGAVDFALRKDESS